MTDSTLTDAQHRALHEVTEHMRSVLSLEPHDHEEALGGLRFALDLVEAVLANDDEHIRVLFQAFYNAAFDEAYARADRRRRDG
jgi:hypothetical protein